MRNHVFATAMVLTAFTPLGHAASSASASLADFRFQLEDLNTSDGVAASYSWINDSTSGGTALSATAADKAGDAGNTKNKGQAFYQYSVNGSSDYAQASAAVGNWSLTANGSANSGASNFGASAATGLGGSGVLGDVLLAPHAKLTITASASLLTSASDPGGAGVDWAKAFASLGLTYSYGSGASAVNKTFTDSLNATASASGYYDYVLNKSSGKMEMTWVSGATQSDNRNRDLTVVFENTSDQFQRAALSLTTKVSGVGYELITPAIPEPESAWFALAGVGGLGVAARRRKDSSNRVKQG